MALSAEAMEGSPDAPFPKADQAMRNSLLMAEGTAALQKGGYAAQAPPVAAAADGGAGKAPAATSSSVKEERNLTRRDATLLPPRRLPMNSRYNTLLMGRQKTLGSKDLADQVKLPQGADVEEWLAITTIDFFNELNLLIGAVQDLCTESTCPQMCAGPYIWLWADGEKIKEPTKMSAPRYFEHLLTWVDAQLADESFLPVQPGVPFPPNFLKGMRVIYKRLFRIYAHVFHSHFKEMMEDEADAHLNHSFKHFVYFVKEFDLIDTEEMEPLKDLVNLCMDQKVRGVA